MRTKGATMLDAVSHVGIWVRDQDEAKAFYTEKVGLEVREDATLEELGGYRWLTVGPPGQPELSLILGRPGPPALDPEGAEQVLALVAKGAMGGGIFRTEDCRETCKQLEARGLELDQQPVERFYGIDATFRDPSGNLWRVVQPLEYDIDKLQG
jgi:catechol 2,3-dioxygenase-like lactoylglutathione lyase family enzyme